MKLHTSWLDDEANAVPEERETVAHLKVEIGDKNATAHKEDGEERECLLVSVYGLAEGLAREWWQIMGNRDGEISLQRYRDGYVLPDVRLMFDGERFRIWADKLELENPPIHFNFCPEIFLGRAEFEGTVTDFIDKVLNRLQEKKLPSASLELCWARVMESLNNSEEVAFCEAAGALRLDPYSISDADREFIFKAASKFKDEALLEYLSCVKDMERSDTIESLDAMSSLTGDATRLADLRSIANAAAGVAPRISSDRPWALGYKRANKVREVMLSPGGQNLSSVKSSVEEMAAMFGAGSEYIGGGKNLLGLRALRLDVADDIHVALQPYAAGIRETQRRFAFAHAIGDAICYPNDGSAPIISYADSGYRQAAGRAFAAEFLAPIDIVEQMKEDGKDIDKIAADLKVSYSVIYWQLDNADNIRAACAT